MDCGPLQPPTDGTINFLNSSTTYLSTVTYGCTPRYDIEGSRTRVCMADGLWSGVEPFCAGTVMTAM